MRGTGTGRRLIERQLRSLADAGAAGCHLDVAAANANAIAFYGHLGWEVLDRDDDTVVMGISSALTSGHGRATASSTSVASPGPSST